MPEVNYPEDIFRIKIKKRKILYRKKSPLSKNPLSKDKGNTRSCHQRCSVKKHFFRNFAKFTGFRPATLLKERLWHRRFPVNFTKFLRTPFLQNTSGRLLLKKANFGKSCKNFKIVDGRLIRKGKGRVIFDNDGKLLLSQ